MIRYLPFLIEIALLVYCLIDCIQTDVPRNLSKTTWVFVIILLPVVGGIAWLVAGRPEHGPRRDVPWPSTQTAGFPEYERPRRTSPDDDPEFLAGMRVVGRQAREDAQGLGGAAARPGAASSRPTSRATRPDARGHRGRRIIRPCDGARAWRRSSSSSPTTCSRARRTGRRHAGRDGGCSSRCSSWPSRSSACRSSWSCGNGRRSRRWRRSTASCAPSARTCGSCGRWTPAPSGCPGRGRPAASSSAWSGRATGRRRSSRSTS